MIYGLMTYGLMTYGSTFFSQKTYGAMMRNDASAAPNRQLWCLYRV
jgi:hypothetical protein